ncbi:MAG: redox-sensing transcriptional repressor Rex [Dehalococcoidia bacterium]
MPLDIPGVVIERLPVYARTLTILAADGIEVVSSQELGNQLGVTPAQIRKDLSYFGRFGKQGRGYHVTRLLDHLRQILALDRRWSMALVGVGQLGRAILHYGGFKPQGFDIVAAFDADPALIGTEMSGVRVYDVRELKRRLAGSSVQIGIVAVPAHQAQDVIDALIGCGLEAILNYAPVVARIPPHLKGRVRLQNIDPVLALQSMTYYLKDAADAASK